MGIWDVKYKEGIRSAWTANPIVFAEVNRRMTGQNKHWMNWLFEDYLQEKPQRLLSIGCGDGAHELIMSERGYAGAIDAFDASPVGIAAAQEKAAAKGLGNLNFHVRTFEEFIAAPGHATYDAILFSGSMHHVRDLEGMLARARDLLARPHGVMIFNEYIGPCYNIYDEKRTKIINDALDSIAPDFKMRANSQWENPTIETVYAVDPTESVRSSLIMQFVEFYFDYKMKNFFGGSLLHPIFDHLDSRRLGDGSAESETVVRMLVTLENLLIDAGVLPHDFCFAVCSPR